MYIPTYKQVVLLVVGLVLVVVSISKLLHTHGTSRGTAIHSGDFHAFNNLSVPMPLVKAKQTLVTDQGSHSTSADDIWYSRASVDEQKRARLFSELNMPSFCKYLKDTISEATGSRHVANALWYLSLDEGRFVEFRSRRISGYDEELENAVAKGMAGAVERVLNGHGNFEIKTGNSGDILIVRTRTSGSVHFEIPGIRTLSDTKTLFVRIKDNRYEVNENLWICRAWHALRVIFPALRDLFLTRDEFFGRRLAAEEMKSIGRCVGVERLGLNSCVSAGNMRHFSGSTVASSINSLLLRGLTIQSSDVEAISGFSMHKLLFYHDVEDVRDSNLAKLLECEAIADRLTVLYVLFLDDTGISAREISAIANLRNVQSLRLLAEKSESRGYIARILGDTPVAAGLRMLSLAFSTVSSSDLDAVGDIGGLEYLSLSCRRVTDKHLTRIGVRAAAASIRMFTLKHADVDTIFGGMAAFKKLSSLNLEKYTASAGFLPEWTVTLAGYKRIKRLMLVNKRLLPQLLAVIAVKQDLEELFLYIDTLSGTELAIALTNKHVLRVLRVVGGDVAEPAIGAILKLDTLASLDLKNVTMSYKDLTRLVGNENLRNRTQGRLRMHIKVSLLGKNEVDSLHRHGLGYDNGVITS